MEEEAREGLWKKYVLFGGMRLPFLAAAKTSPTRGSRSRKATSASPRLTAATASATNGVYPMPSSP